VGYRLFHTPQGNPEESPSQLIEDLLAGKLDVALVWGPFAGYYVKKRSAPLQLAPLRGGSPATPFGFEISMGVRKGEGALKAELEEVIEKDAAAIRSILEEYGVPLVVAEISDGDTRPEALGGKREHEGGVHRH
jgi:mxaJ protein